MAKATPEAEAVTPPSDAVKQAVAQQASAAMAKAATKAVQSVDEDISPVAKVARAAFKQLPPQEIQTIGAKWNHWAVMAHAEHSIEDVCHPRYLWAKADQMKPGDYVEIKHIYGKFVVCLDVTSINHVARGIVANVRHVFDYTQPGARQITPHLIEARVAFLGARGWCVVDGTHVAADGFRDKQAADKWLDEERYRVG